MNKRKAILMGLAVILGTITSLFTVLLFLLWMAERAEEYSRGG
jgi:hypothetical protein